MKRLATAFVIAASLTAVSAPSASATSSRAEYIAQVEQLCVASQQQVEKHAPKQTTIDPFKIKHQSDEGLRDQARRLGPVIKALGRLIGQIAAVPPAPADELAVAQWITGLHGWKRGFDRSIRALRRGDGPKAARLLDLNFDRIVRAYEPVRDFDFGPCLAFG
jgi:hypothetical protein